MKIMFRSMPHIEKLVELVEKASGNVFLQTAADAFSDMKKSENAAGELRRAFRQNQAICLHVFAANDIRDFAGFMLGTPYGDAPAQNA